MPANTPVYSVNAKWVTDHGSQVYNVMGYGCYGDGVHDDTACIQSVLDLFTNGSTSTASGTIYFPPGHYKITNYLWYVGSYGNTLKLQGSAGNQLGATGPSIDYYGPATSLAMFMPMGAPGLEVDGLAFNANSLAQYTVWLAATNGLSATLGTAVTPGTQTVTPSAMCGTQGCIRVGTLLNVDTGVNNTEMVLVTATGGGSPATTFTATFQKSHSATAPIGGLGMSNVKFVDDSFYGYSGSTSAGVVIGSSFGGQVSEINFYNCFFSGTGAYAGIYNPYGFNIQNFRIHGGSMSGSQYGLYAQQVDAVKVEETNFGAISVAAIRTLAAAVTVIGTHGESNTGELLSGGMFGNATLIGNTWVTTLSNSNDIIIDWSGGLVLMNNWLYNWRTSTSVPKISIVYPTFNPGSQFPSSVFSSGNYFARAPAGYAPFVVYPSNQVLPRYSVGNGYGTIAITSIGDMGDCALQGFPSCPLSNFIPATFLASTNSTDIAGTGVLNVGDTECAVAFLNHAKSADVPGICKNTSDVVLLGGTPGVSASQYSATVATGAPPLSVTSTTPVANLTVQNCDTCNITTSMTVGGGTALHAMNLYNTASITPTAVTASSCSDQTFSVSGLLATDIVSSIAPPSALGNLSLHGYASAANTVLFHFCNPSSSPVTPPAGVYSFLAVH